MFMMLTFFSGGTQPAIVPAEETSNYDQIKPLRFLKV